MGLPKKKIDLPINQTGQKRQEELVEKSNEKSTYLPPSILLEDLDLGFFDFIEKDGVNLVIEGKEVPCIWVSNERWADFEKTWSFVDADEQPVMPYITIRRPEAPTNGTHPLNKWNVAQNRTYQYVKIPVFENGVHGVDIYSIPIPSSIDLTFEVKLFTHYVQDTNLMNEKILKLFSSRQAYQTVKGYFIPIKLETISDDSSNEDVDGQKFFMNTYKFVMQGFIQDEKDFVVTKGLRRTVESIKIK